MQGTASFIFNYEDLEMHKDSGVRPLYTILNMDESDGKVLGAKVFLETFSPYYKLAYDFIIAIAEPVSRPEFVHEYKITQYSLYAAASIGLSFADIISALKRLSKNILQPSLEDYVKENTERCGKLRMVLRNRRYFVESTNPNILHRLLAEKEISELRRPTNPDEGEVDEHGFYVETISKKVGEFDDQAKAMGLESTQDSNTSFKIHSFEIAAIYQEKMRKLCHEREYPLLEEYDFKKDDKSLDLPIALKPHAKHRPYQQKSLSKMFGNGRARSGIIVLPCGAGKTLVGISALCTIKQSCLIFANSSVSVNQWAKQVMFWTNVPSERIIKFTSQNKKPIPKEPCIVITTYQMFGMEKKLAASTKPIMEAITKRDPPWGLVLLDEVHVCPATSFRKCVGKTDSRCKLGLTATLIREDGKEQDLYYLVGPKLYEANWLDLQRDGYLAKAQCIEVSCQMPYCFYKKYLEYKSQPNSHRLAMMMYECNPNKFRTCQHLINIHLARGDKVLVFSNNVWVLKHYALKLGYPYIYGKTVQWEREKCLAFFNSTSDAQHQCLFISSVGDTSIDLPEVNVLIQISSHFSSRRQEAQRLGRILRPKQRHGDEYNAFFYTLVSKDTKDEYYSLNRRRFLMNQGYSVHVISDFVKDIKGLHYSTKEQVENLLQKVIEIKDSKEQLEDINPNEDVKERKKRQRKRQEEREGQALFELTGEGGMYEEYKKQKSTRKRKRNAYANNRLNNLMKRSKGEKDAELLGLETADFGEKPY